MNPAPMAAGQWAKLLCAGILVAGLARSQQTNLSDRLHAALGSDAGTQASEAIAAGRYSQVEDQLQTALLTDTPRTAELMALSGAIAFLAGDYQKASRSFQQSAARKPLSEADAFTLAMADIRCNRGTEARTVLESLTAGHPNHALYLYWLGRLDYDQRLYDRAIVRLRQAVALDPASSRAWNSLALCFDMEGNTDEAAKAFSRAVTLNRTQPRPSAWPPHDYGYLLLRRERLSEAVELLEEAIRYDGQLAQAHYHLGRAYEKQGRSELARTEFRTAMRFDPATPDAAYSLGQLERQSGHDSDAVAAFNEYRRRKALQIAR